MIHKIPGMKIFLILATTLALVLFSRCSGTRSANQTKEKKIVDRGYDVAYDSDIAQSTNSTNPNEKGPSNRSLTDMILAKPGVTMTSQGPRIGGVGSFSNNEPLYIINGTAVSGSYDQIVGMINPNDVTSITILKGSEAAIYGSRGGNGVILIRTK